MDKFLGQEVRQQVPHHAGGTVRTGEGPGGPPAHQPVQQV